MGKTKHGLLIFMIVACPFALSGCWNYKEINEMAIVAGMAIDKDLKTDKYIVTTEIINVQPKGNTSSIGSELYSTEGDSIFDAVRNMIAKTGLRLYWSNAKVIILSEEIARTGVSPVLDWFAREAETRGSIWLLVSKSSTAAEILKNKVMLNEVVSFHLDEGMQNEKLLSKFAGSMLLEFLDVIAAAGNAGTIATVKNETTDGSIAPRINGTAIIKSDKLVGFLDGTQTFYMLILQDKFADGLITLKNVSDSGTAVTLELTNTKTKVTPINNNGILSMTIDVGTVAVITEIHGNLDVMLEENLKKLTFEAEKKIKNELQNLLNKIKFDYDADIFGFEAAFAKNKPKVYKNFKKSDESILSTLKTQINVHMNIKGSATMLKPLSNGSQ